MTHPPQDRLQDTVDGVDTAQGGQSAKSALRDVAQFIGIGALVIAFCVAFFLAMTSGVTAIQDRLESIGESASDTSFQVPSGQTSLEPPELSEQEKFVRGCQEIPPEGVDTEWLAIHGPAVDERGVRRIQRAEVKAPCRQVGNRNVHRWRSEHLELMVQAKRQTFEVKLLEWHAHTHGHIAVPGNTGGGDRRDRKVGHVRLGEGKVRERVDRKGLKPPTAAHFQVEVFEARAARPGPANDLTLGDDVADGDHHRRQMGVEHVQCRTVVSLDDQLDDPVRKPRRQSCRCDAAIVHGANRCAHGGGDVDAPVEVIDQALVRVQAGAERRGERPVDRGAARQRPDELRANPIFGHLARQKVCGIGDDRVTRLREGNT